MAECVSKGNLIDLGKSLEDNLFPGCSRIVSVGMVLFSLAEFSGLQFAGHSVFVFSTRVMKLCC